MMQTVVLAVIMGLVFIALPVFLGRKSGKSPMELIFGSRVNDTPFGRKTEDASGAGTAKKKASGRKPQNGTKQELFSMISSLLSYARRNHFCFIVPGTLEWEGKVSTLAVLLITRNAFIGINCFGYGGTIQCERGEADWLQTLGDEKRHIESPAKKNKEQEAIVRAVLDECGYADRPLYIFGVFTSPQVQLKSRTGEGFYTKNELMQTLGATRFLQDKGLDPDEACKKVGQYAKKA